MNYKSRSHNYSKREAVVYTALMIVAVLLFYKAMAYGIDKSIENQDRMLCNSAKISGNTEYLNKCDCFYKTDDITCLQK